MNSNQYISPTEITLRISREQLLRHFTPLLLLLVNIRFIIIRTDLLFLIGTLDEFAVNWTPGGYNIQLRVRALPKYIMWARTELEIKLQKSMSVDMAFPMALITDLGTG